MIPGGRTTRVPNNMPTVTASLPFSTLETLAPSTIYAAQKAPASKARITPVGLTVFVSQGAISTIPAAPQQPPQYIHRTPGPKHGDHHGPMNSSVTPKPSGTLS